MIRVDYAGPGGACEGIRSLGLESYGIEWDAAACATRAAAGHRTIRADLSTYRPGGRPEGYWGSPPCQTFSTAGKGDGRAELDRLAEVIHGERWADADLFDPRTRHVIDAARVAVTCGAEWVAMEQVPGVLPLWRALGHVLDAIVDPDENRTIRDEAREIAAEGIRSVKDYLKRVGIGNEKSLAEVRRIMAEAEAIEVETSRKRTENQHRQLALLAKKLKLVIQAQLYAETGSVDGLLVVLSDLEKA